MHEYDVYKLIRMGIIISITISAIGLLTISMGVETTMSKNPTLAEFISGICRLDPLAIIYLGIMILILIPPATLTYLIISYLIHKNTNMGLLTTSVLIILITITLIKLFLL